MVNLLRLSALSLILLLSANLEARRFGSFSSRRSSWGRSSSSRSSWGRSSTSRSRSASLKSNTASKQSYNKTSYYQQARRNNTVFSDRQQASKAFEQRYRNNYPSRFSRQPSARPDYIPTNASLSGGQSAPIFYNRAVGGYGYRDPLGGGFMLYSVFRDATMISLLMGRNNYYYGAPPPPLAASTGGGFLKLAIWLLMIFVAINVIARLMGQRRQ